MFEHYQLKNKANVYLVPQDNTPSMTILVMYPVGSRYESDNLSGVSHYIEHLMFKGTKKRKNTLILTREIDRLGAQYNAFTGKEYTGYYIKVNADYAETAIDIISDMLTNSKFEKKEMEREKTVIVEEIRMYKDNPLINIENIFEDLLYDGCALGRDIAGSEQKVRDFKRDEVLEFKQKHYRPDNMNIVVAGHIGNETKDYIGNFFDNKLAETKRSGAKKYSPSKLGRSAKDKRIKVEQKSTDQAQIMLGFPAFPYNHHHNAAATVLNTILGGSMSSRLFIEIRERRGLAYSVRSGVEKFRDTGYFYVRAGLEAKNINEAIKVTKHEIEKIISKGASARELRDAKTNIHGSLILSLEDSSAQANWYASEALFSKKIKTPSERLKEVEKVTNAEIKEVAKKILIDNKMRIGIIGNVEECDIMF